MECGMDVVEVDVTVRDFVGRVCISWRGKGEEEDEFEVGEVTGRCVCVCVSVRM